VPELLKSLSSALARPKIQALVKSKLFAMSSGDEAGADAKKWISAVGMKPATAPKELPKGGLAFEVLVSVEGGAPEGNAKGAAAKKPKAALTPLKLYVFVVPEAAQTWVAVGGDKVQLVKPLLAAIEGAPEAGTLASSQDVAALRNDKLSAASFTTIESLLQAWSGPAAWLDADASRSTSGPYALLASTPHKGKTPILMRSEVTASAAISWTVRAELPKGVIEDAIILGASSGFSGLPRP
jgi:hypothetical protein